MDQYVQRLKSIIAKKAKKEPYIIGPYMAKNISTYYRQRGEEK